MSAGWAGWQDNIVSSRTVCIAVHPPGSKQIVNNTRLVLMRHILLCCFATALNVYLSGTDRLYEMSMFCSYQLRRSFMPLLYAMNVLIPQEEIFHFIRSALLGITIIERIIQSHCVFHGCTLP